MSRVTDGVQIREMTVSDASAIVSLNQSVVSVTSPMDRKKFGNLFELSTSSPVAVLNGKCVGFLIAIERGVDYDNDNDNFSWFTSCLNDFLYIDRVVVSSECRGLGVGSLLYSHLFESARNTKQRRITAEIDVEPPNQPSLRFHEKMGFVEIGTRELASGKRVSMQVCRVRELT